MSDPKAGGAREHAEHYRPELDGLRAIAVAAVLLFHLDPTWLSGGFAGVDVFFVLSGFLVASILLRNHEAGHLQLRTFYQRRIARIFPAFLTMAVATLFAAKFCYSSWDYASAGASFSAALLSSLNFHLIGQGNYFQLSRDAQPLLHCWSLSIEEQFYLVFPLFFALLLKVPARSRLILIWLLTLLSFGTCLVLTDTKPVHAFYLLPSRAWELLAGSLIALHAASRPSSTSPPARQLLAPMGLAAIITSFYVLAEGPRFPGWLALLPVLGTAAVIRYGPAGPVHRLLSARPFPLIGRLSYSLYLWHWPIFSMVDYTLLYQSPTTRLLLKIILTGVAAGLSFRLIEQPARAWLNHPGRHRLPLVMLGIALTLLVPFGYMIHRRHYPDASNGTHGVLTFPVLHPRGTLLLLGDSHGSMYGQLAQEIASEHGLNLTILSTAGEDPLTTSHGPPPDLFASNLDFIRREKPTVILLACHWIYKLQNDPSRLGLTIQAFRPHTGKIIILTQPPLLPSSATRSALRLGSRPPFYESPDEQPLRQRLNQTVKSLASPDVIIIDTDPFFIHPDQSIVTHDDSGRSLFHDRLHLSTQGADRIKSAITAAVVSVSPILPAPAASHP